ncbi:APC amino acid permease [Schizopora paradoxa]|uniref:APC amino acid permease n=1 Tax=Schizopora paradoxa TaxID=27342 RepID=A0A0H2SCI0_9AGAM|nr:APC amino acid permease [Schizopora paradoxa]
MVVADAKSASASETNSLRSGDASVNADEAFLSTLGYKQEFKREFTRFELFGVAFSIIGVLPSIASVLVFAIPNGGPIALVWGWAVCAFFIFFIALSMAELGSAMPTSGGLYYWTFSFASPRYRRLLSWIVGYSNSIGLISGVAGVDWGCAVQVMAAASIGSDMAFAPTTRQTFGVFVALLIAHGILCSMATRVLARLQTFYIVINFVICFAVIIALPAATPKEFRNDASYALGGFANLAGWPNGFAFILSFLAPVWTINAFDSTVHISEEAANARTAVPFAIIASTFMAGVLGWGMNMAFVFNMGQDMESILSNPIGQPLATIFFNSLGKSGTLALWSLLVIAQFMMGSSALLATSRQMFAFARDGALPFSSVLHRIDSRTRTPVIAVWVCVSGAFLVGLLTFAGAAAINAIFAMGVCAQYLAYGIPIACFALAKGTNRARTGPFTLGRLSFPIAATAVIWMIFASIIVLFPSVPAPTPNEMNYATVVFGGVLGLAIIYYFFPRYGGMYWFQGPLGALRVLENDAKDRSSNFSEKDSERKGESESSVEKIREVQNEY